MSLLSSPWQRILLATEHTEFDVGSERLAVSLALRTGQPLRAIVPIVSNSELLAEAPIVAQRGEEEVAVRRAELARMASVAGVSLEIRVGSEPDPWRTIVAAAADTRADLVVVRRRGHRGFFSRLMVGEMSANVATHAPCDVLMAPRASQMWTGGVLAAVDDSPASSRVANVASAVARDFGLALQLVSVTSGPSTEHGEQVLRREGEALARDRTAPNLRLLIGRPPEQIVSAARRYGADLIVVGRRGASGPIRRAVLGGTAEKVIALATGPVLVVKT